MAEVAAAKPKQKATSRDKFLELLADQAALTNHRKSLIYGPSGSGKTTLAGSAGEDERTSPSLLLDFEGGAKSALGYSGTTIIRVKDWNDYTTVYNYLAEGGYNDYKSLTVDSVSETHVGSLLHIVDEEIKTDSRRKEAGDLVVEQQDYGRAMVWLRRFLRRFRDLPMHVFFTALPKTDIEGNEGYVHKPALFGQMANEIVGMFDVNAYLAIKLKRQEDPKAKKVTENILYLQNQTGMRVKVRSPKGVIVPNSVVLPREGGMTVFLDAIQVPYE